MAGDALLEGGGLRADAVSWYTVGRIIERVVVDERARQGDPLDRLRRIGIDELSYRGGSATSPSLSTTTGLLVWAEEGRDKETVARFFAELRPERSAGSSSSRATWASGSPARSPSTARK